VSITFPRIIVHIVSRLLLPARLLVFHRPKIFFRAGVGVAWIFLLTAAAPGLAASDEAQGPALDQAISPSLVTSIQQYWDLTPEQKSRPMALRLECDVTYFDAGWKMLFIQDVNGRAAYAPYGDNAFEFKAGQHILATGVILPPNADVSFEHATITLKGPAQTVPLPIDGKVTQFWHFTSRFVSLEGLVDHIERIDPSHMRLSLSVEGEAVFALVLFDAGDDVPNLKDTIMRIEGVYNAKIGPDTKFASLEILVPGLNHLNIVNRLEDDPRFLTPVVPIETLPRLPGDRLAHIAPGALGSLEIHVERGNDFAGNRTLAVRQHCLDLRAEGLGELRCSDHRRRLRRHRSVHLGLGCYHESQ